MIDPRCRRDSLPASHCSCSKKHLVKLSLPRDAKGIRIWVCEIPVVSITQVDLPTCTALRPQTQKYLVPLHHTRAVLVILCPQSSDLAALQLNRDLPDREIYAFSRLLRHAPFASNMFASGSWSLDACTLIAPWRISPFSPLHELLACCNPAVGSIHRAKCGPKVLWTEYIYI
ncbi:hypothetical protein CH063_05357 [Colletotrichum higginsianum]|uniref:Uncharacterized protein n=1 Tax=Colletotrichum higginsianum (strain IMI 349063) TaxID=759273 RepID=H1UYP9_COLHI|nr:hypothetical protein CH063_05357 [Colletotrichum higginsianum]